MKFYGILFITLITFFAPLSASADLILGLEGGGALPIGDWRDDVRFGPQIEGRIAYELKVPLVTLAPELKVQWALNPYRDISDSDGIKHISVMGGLRIGVEFVVGIYLFGHVGWGQVEAEGSDWTYHDSGRVYDLGAALTLKLIPFFAIGIQCSYHNLKHKEVSNTSLPDSNEWINFGLLLEGRFF